MATSSSVSMNVNVWHIIHPPSMIGSCYVRRDCENSYTQHSHPLALSHYLAAFLAIKFSPVKFYSYCQPALQNGYNNLQCTIQCEELTMRFSHSSIVSQSPCHFWRLGELSGAHCGSHIHSHWEVKSFGVHTLACAMILCVTTVLSLTWLSVLFLFPKDLKDDFILYPNPFLTVIFSHLWIVQFLY